MNFRPPAVVRSLASCYSPEALRKVRFHPCRSRSSTGRAFSAIQNCQRQSQAGDPQHIAGESGLTDGRPQRKGARLPKGKTSLRRVAVEAQRTREGFIRGKGKRRFVDPDAPAKTVTAYCAAEQYNIHTAAQLLRNEGHELDPFKTSLYPQVIHVRLYAPFGSVTPTGEDFGDLFVFSSGTLVTWGLRERVATDFVYKTLRPAAQGDHVGMMETEDLEYLEDPSHEESQMIGDTIILGSEGKSSRSDDHMQRGLSDDETDRHEVDTILAKIAFSSGLARSAKLAVLEALLDNYFDSTRDIPAKLSRGSKLPFKRSFILQKTGELLSVRAQLNLYSELTDTSPDLFWESRQELGLEMYYDQVGKALDVGPRIEALNDRMDYAQEIASVLRERLSEKRSHELEVCSTEATKRLWN